MTITLRKAQPNDYPAINDLATALVQLPADRRASLQAVLAHPDHDLIVAEADGDVVGFAHLLTYHDLAHGALSGELLGLVVREDRRRQGIGRALLTEIIALAGKRGVCEFHINAEQDNFSAQKLYQSIGAEVVGVQMEVKVRAHGPEHVCDQLSAGWEER